jgi:hypothetical protein
MESAPPSGRRRFRVAIKPSTLDPTLLVVRRLEEGMALPPGSHEGWIESSHVEVAHANGKSAQ